MFLPRKIILLAILVHLVTIFACASLQPEEEQGQEDAEKQLTTPQIEEDAETIELDAK